MPSGCRSPYGALVATIDRIASSRAGVGIGAGDGPRQQPPPGGRRAPWEGYWFTPATGLRPRPLEVLLVAAVAFIQVAGTAAYYDEAPVRWAVDALAVVLLLVGPLALLFRRRWPEATLAVTFVAAAVYTATGYPRAPGGTGAFAVALVTAIVMGRRAFAWCVLAVAFVAFVLLPYLVPDEMEAKRSVAGSALNVASWLPLVGVGSELARSRLERRAEWARAERDDARRRASEERLLIARELHDVLAHNISLINVRSGVALHMLDEQPGQARPALQAISEASEQALGELRSVLDILSRGLDADRARDTNGDGDEAPRAPAAWAPTAPTAGLRDLDGLVRRTRAAGLDVRLAVEGEAGPVPTGVDLAAFRIVQEALTNVVRHAGDGARATVRLVHSPAELVVQVDDDGRGIDTATAGTATAGAAAGGVAAANGDGRGIPGMRERVHALGGTFVAAPRPGRGFRVRAQLPLQGGV
jgi:signal transduction histidine kinase